MKSFFKVLILSSFLILMSFTKEDCSILKNGTFTYKNGKDDVLVSFNGNEHIEYHNDKKYYIKSRIEWISDCEYFLTLKEITLPNLPFKAGAKLHIKVNKIKKNRIYYTSTMGSRSWEGRLTKIEKADN